MWNFRDVAGMDWVYADGKTPDLSSLITPYLPVVGILLGSILVGVFAVWNRRHGAVETRAPDVNEIWKQQAEQSAQLDLERKLRRKLEDYARDLLRTYRSYVWRVRGGGSIELTSHERRFFDIDPPTGENETHP
jgi:hypothetical protein